jgi:hypothetical protein
LEAKQTFSNKVSNIVRTARFDSMVRNFFEMFLRARRALEFSHSQDPSRHRFGPGRDPNPAVQRSAGTTVGGYGLLAIEVL